MQLLHVILIFLLLLYRVDFEEEEPPRKRSCNEEMYEKFFYKAVINICMFFSIDLMSDSDGHESEEHQKVEWYVYTIN